MALSRQTLCYVFRPGDRGQQQVLLGRKRRGFGTGKIMGLGGHADPGESEAACALREVQEESGIAIVPESLTWRAALTFIFPARPELNAGGLSRISSGVCRALDHAAGVGGMVPAPGFTTTMEHCCRWDSHDVPS